jgi:uroporphyrinogen-III decarboxylase
MNHKERVLAALNHQETDKVPVDFGSTAVTGIHVNAVASLRDYYGLEKRPVKVHEPYQMLGWIDPDLQEVLGIDTDALCPRNTMFGFPNENWKEWKMPNGLVVLVSEHFKTTRDENGDILIFPEGDVSAPPCAKMPNNGFFFDTIVRQEPIDEAKLNPEDNLEEFGPISEEDLIYLKQETERLKHSDRAVVATFAGTAFGDIALVPAPFLKYPKGIRDITEWYISTRTRQDYIHKVFEKQCEIALQNLAAIHSVIGELPVAVFLCGTDFGTQTSTFCSKETFQSLYMPYYKQITDWIHQNTSWKCFKHSCGAVEPFIDLFIEAGFDIFNPVQCSAKGMDPAHLNETYGDRIVFWGGGIDTQKTLPMGSTQEIRDEVLSRCEIFSKNGGFIFNAVHNIQANTPIENLAALFEAVKEYNGVK